MQILESRVISDRGEVQSEIRYVVCIQKKMRFRIVDNVFLVIGDSYVLQITNRGNSRL